MIIYIVLSLEKLFTDRVASKQLYQGIRIGRLLGCCGTGYYKVGGDLFDHYSGICGMGYDEPKLKGPLIMLKKSNSISGPLS